MPYLALIEILSTGGSPSHPIAPGQPPGIWPGPGGPSQGPGFPTPPIYLPPGQSPPGIWPSPGHPSHPIAPGGQPPGASQGPGFPSHPIELPPGTVIPPPGVNIPVFPGQLPVPGGPEGGGSGGTPGWPSMPGTGPSHPISGGYVLVYHPMYGWILIAPGGGGGSGSGSPPAPDQGLPGAQPHPDQGLPSEPKPDQGLPGSESRRK